ncbi:MAG TPA: HlyD family efflux transporter periplasmic adaptor subunit [Bryobacteraceae bacterium]|jgi:HlyD family secretion protein
MTDEKTIEASSAAAQQETPIPHRPNGMETRPSRRRRIVPVAAILLLGVGGFLIWRFFFATPEIPDSIVTLSGRIEGDDSAVASKTTGRILEIRVREGETINAGDVIAVLDDEQVRAREEQARAGLTAADARTASARAQISILEEQLRQSQLETEQSKVDSEGRVGQAQAELGAAEADLAQKEAAYQLALFDKEAYTRLAQTGAVSERRGKEAVATADQQGASVAAAKRRVEAARGSLTAAQASLSNPGIREAQVAGVRRQIAQQNAEIANAAASSQQAHFQLAEAQANRRDLTVRAPFTGTVITRTAEPGEVISAGTAIITLLDLSKVYLRGFVPEGQVGKVKLGQPGHVYLDSNPSQALDAYVLRIDPQATFTPENTYFRQDRVKQVVGVKLRLKNGIGYAKPGMPADGEILVQGSEWPAQTAKR